MKRRDFIVRGALTAAVMGSAAAWPVVARAQGPAKEPARPVIGFLNDFAPEAWPPAMTGFRRGLSEAHYAEGQNVAFTYRWSEGRRDLLPDLAADLVRNGVAMIVASADTATALAARAPAKTPVVFVTEDDPVRFGLVAAIDRPGGRATGMYLRKSQVNNSLRGELWQLLLPDNKSGFNRIQIFDSSSVAINTDPEVAFAFNLDPVRRNNPRIIMPPLRSIMIECSPFLDKRRRDQLIALPAQHRLPTIYEWAVFPAEGGLLSYGIDIEDVYAQVGRYAGDILDGRDPAEMPVLKPGKFQSALNLRTAAELGLNVSNELRARLDKVIE
jgi:putative ABC transport system substrate-binding protein